MDTMDTGWTLEIKDQSWVEDTENQVDFIIKTLKLTGKERILDLACGFGRHSISLARRGFSVVGVDFTKAYIDDAVKTAASSALKVQKPCHCRNLIGTRKDAGCCLPIGASPSVK